MSEILTTPMAIEKGTFAIVATITDEDGAALVPNTLTWTLTDEDGTVINSRSAVVVNSPASVNNIVLSGADLALSVATNRSELRVLTLEGTYDSSYGVDLPLKDAIKFYVYNIIAVT
ncbi:MAG: hypothetical protein GWO23_12500 [Gammaproteobacteria bacterium]|nr:hypothetical protein [Gammaproteobacteria bacterium]